jgi:hypothetical protein
MTGRGREAGREGGRDGGWRGLGLPSPGPGCFTAAAAASALPSVAWELAPRTPLRGRNQRPERKKQSPNPGRRSWQATRTCTRSWRRRLRRPSGSWTTSRGAFSAFSSEACPRWVCLGGDPRGILRVSGRFAIDGAKWVAWAEQFAGPGKHIHAGFGDKRRSWLGGP